MNLDAWSLVLMTGGMAVALGSALFAGSKKTFLITVAGMVLGGFAVASGASLATASPEHDHATAAANLKSRYGATVVGHLYWDSATERMAMKFRDSSIRDCRVTGQYRAPVLLCGGKEADRIG